MSDLACKGTFRIYFNRHGAAPLVWCVASEHWELAVSGITVHAPMRTVYDPDTKAADFLIEPAAAHAWCEVKGELVVRNSHATITPV